MNDKNESKLKSDKLHLWQRWEKECQYLIIFSALASGMVETANAQSTDVPNGTTQNTPIVLNEDGDVLNNNGTIAVAGAGTTAVDTSANDTTINNGTAGGTGIISGDSRAVDVTAGTGATINNAAGSQILATGDQRNGTVYVDSDTDNVTINNDGSIDASSVQGAGISAELSAAGNNIDISNTGTIAGGGAASAGSATAGDGIRLERTRVAGALEGSTTGIYQGTITNSAGASITSDSTDGTTAGIRAVNGVSFQGTIDNAGTISGVQNGVYFGNAVPAGGADHTGGVLNNSGDITSDSRAVNIDGTGLTVNNSGNILGTGNQRNGTLYVDGTADDYTINNEAGGVIDAGEGNLGSGVAAEVGSAADGVTSLNLTNDGTITGRGSADPTTGSAGDGVRIGNAGNSGTAEGSIVNNGTITAESTAGTTGAIRVVDNVGFQGNIDNTGTIAGAQNGVYYGNGDHTGGVLNNSGDITSNSRAVNIDGTGVTVNNLGNILGTGDQRNGTLYVDGTADDYTINNESGGIIDAGEGNLGSGVAAEVGDAADDVTSLSLTNDGTITGRGSADPTTGSAGDGVRIGNPGNSGTAEGSIVNNGTITAESTAGTTGAIRVVDNVGFQGNIDNTGTIAGAQNGVYYGNGDHTGGVLNNSGDITSNSRAVNIDGTGVTVNNSGNILGTGDQRNGTIYVDGTFNDVTINNQAEGVIDAGAVYNGSGVSVQVDSSAEGRNADINNYGTIQGRGTGSAAGVRVFGADTADVANVNITNNAGGSIISDNEAGVLVENVNYNGTITNSGTITGATAAIDTTSALGNVTIDQLDGNLNGDVLTGGGDDTLNIDGNSNLTGLIDLGAGNNNVNVLSNGTANITGQSIENSDLTVYGTLAVDLASPFTVGGVATFNEGSNIALSVDNVAAVNLNEGTTILSADSVTGNATVVEDSALVDFTTVQTADTIELQASAADLTQQTNDANILALGQAVQAGLGVNTDAAFAQTVNQLDGVGTAGFEALASELLPDLSAGTTREFYENQAHTFNSIERQLAQPKQANSFWFEASARSADRDGGSSFTDTGYSADSTGFILGYGGSITDNVNLGAAISYSDIEVDAGFSSTDIEAYSLNLYGQYNEGDFFVRGAAAYSFGDAESTRLTQFGNISSDSDIDQFSAKLSLGVDKTFGRHKLSPFASVQYSNVSRDGFTENGGLGLSVSDSDVNILELGAGVSHEIDLNPNANSVKLVSRVGYYYDVLDEAASASASINGDSFNLNGSSISQGSLEFATGLEFSLSDSSTLSFGYEGNFASDFDSHTGYLRFRKEF